MGGRFKGLGWFKPLCRGMFSHRTVCLYMHWIAGGDPEEYKRRASKMIAEAKKKGQIRPADGCQRYYVFADAKGGAA